MLVRYEVCEHASILPRQVTGVFDPRSAIAAEARGNDEEAPRDLFRGREAVRERPRLYAVVLAALAATYVQLERHRDLFGAGGAEGGP